MRGKYKGDEGEGRGALKSKKRFLRRGVQEAQRSGELETVDKHEVTQ